MVQPFDAAGAPPAPEPEPKKSHTKAIVITALALLALAAAGFYAYQSGLLKSIGVAPKTAATVTTPTPSATPADLDAALQEADTALGAVNSSLINADSALGDKQGDVSE